MPNTGVREQPGSMTIVEDNPLICRELRGTLEERGWKVDDFGSGEDFLSAFRPGVADCLLLDIELPGISGLDVLTQLRGKGHQTPVIVINGSGDIKYAVAAMKAGANDFIQKPILGPELILAVQRVLEQGDGKAAGPVSRHAAVAQIGILTRRQRQILTLILAGHPNKNIAADIGISQRTVENHRAAIMRRTKSKSLPDLVRLAMIANWSEGEAPSLTLAESVPAVLAATLPAGQLDDDQFRRFFDAIPIPIIISAIADPETILYANPAFEGVTGQAPADVEGKSWSVLSGSDSLIPDIALGQANADANRKVTFKLDRAGGDGVTVDAYVNIIVDDDDEPAFRLAALVRTSGDAVVDQNDLQDKVRERDTIISEIQHRVKNNLQIITSLIRLEARGYTNNTARDSLSRLEGRINSIQIIWKLLSDFSQSDEIDLGVYLSEIATSVMRAHAVEGIRLDLKVDSYLVSVNVALPAGMVANELLTNALKHAFVGRDGGTITLHSLADARGCRVTIADDGVGLPNDTAWPTHGKIGELIVRSLRQNAKADLRVESARGKGTKVIITFNRVAPADAPVRTRVSADA